MTTTHLTAMQQVIEDNLPESASCAAGLAALELLGKFITTTITTDEAARLRAELAALKAEVDALEAAVETWQRQMQDAADRLERAEQRPLFRLPPESTGFLKRLQSKKFLVTVGGVPIAWLASKLGVNQEIVIVGIGALIAFILGQSAVDTATAKAAKPPAAPGG